MSHQDQHLLDVSLEDFTKDQPATENGLEVEMPELPVQISKDTFELLLNHIDFLTKAQITINEETNQMHVVAKDSVATHDAFTRLSNLKTALVCEGSHAKDVLFF